MVRFIEFDRCRSSGEGLSLFVVAPSVFHAQWRQVLEAASWISLFFNEGTTAVTWSWIISSFKLRKGFVGSNLNGRQLGQGYGVITSTLLKTLAKKDVAAVFAHFGAGPGLQSGMGTDQVRMVSDGRSFSLESIQ